LAAQESQIFKKSVKADEVGNMTFKVSAFAKGFDDDQTTQDTLIKQTEILPKGFPIKLSQSGMFKPDNTSGVLRFTLPDTYSPGSLKLNARVFTQPMNNIVDAITSLIRDPYGCFEQYSSITYPLVLALQILNKLDTSNDKISKIIIDAQSKL
jgi:uncharacterized protein YfaS (alpha-2-macroglobulin family)